MSPPSERMAPPGMSTEESRIAWEISLIVRPYLRSTYSETSTLIS